MVAFFGSLTTVLAMSLVLPFLPLYVEQLGVRGTQAIDLWSGAGLNALAQVRYAPGNDG